MCLSNVLSSARFERLLILNCWRWGLWAGRSGVPFCLLGVLYVVVGFLPEEDVRVCLRLARLVYGCLADFVDSLALLWMVGAGESVRGWRFSLVRKGRCWRIV